MANSFGDTAIGKVATATPGNMHEGQEMAGVCAPAQSTVC